MCETGHSIDHGSWKATAGHLSDARATKMNNYAVTRQVHIEAAGDTFEVLAFSTPGTNCDAATTQFIKECTSAIVARRCIPARSAEATHLLALQRAKLGLAGLPFLAECFSLSFGAPDVADADVDTAADNGFFTPSS